ncbi:MAG: hypothetical protein NUV46_01040 [Nanoarchaeota archaeon]|nr:hypothetical protein [Nanoarchaeota archaeon]
MDYTVYTTEKFDEGLKRLSLNEQERIQKIFLQLKSNPYVGDQLQIRILREKRIKEKRIYYLVFDDLGAVLIVAMSNKKAQQKTIDYILEYIEDYRNYMKKLLKMS